MSGDIWYDMLKCWLRWTWSSQYF